MEEEDDPKWMEIERKYKDSNKELSAIADELGDTSVDSRNEEKMNRQITSSEDFDKRKQEIRRLASEGGE